MNYIGSKYKLLEFLENSIKQIATDDALSFCDAFAGTGIVGTHFKKKGYQVISNDLQFYSFVLIRHFVNNNSELKFDQVKNFIPNYDKNKSSLENVFYYLNNLPLIEGFIYKNYTLGGTVNQEFQRMYFSDENGKICDSIRNEIDTMISKRLINENEYFYLLACLLEATDKRANTASVYGAFLKNLKKSAREKIVLKPLDIVKSEKDNLVYNTDVNSLLKSIECDILYLDPPYNTRVYGDNYHILETVAKNDSPKIIGKTGNRFEKTKSNYSSKKEVKKAFTELIQNAKAKYIFLSYNNEGLLSLDEIKDIMSKRGEYGVFHKEYQRFKADKTENRNHKAEKTIEYLHYVIVK